MATALDRYRASVSEAAMETAIRDAVAAQQGRVFHIRRSDSAPEMVDWPDLVVVLPRRGVVAFVELKSAKRKVTNGQAAVIADLRECQRAEAWIVRAGEGRDGEVSYDRFMRWLTGDGVTR